MQYQICKDISDYETSIKLDLNEFDFDHHDDVYKYIKNTLIKPKSITHYSNIFNSPVITDISLPPIFKTRIAYHSALPCFADSLFLIKSSKIAVFRLHDIVFNEL